MSVWRPGGYTIDLSSFCLDLQRTHGRGHRRLLRLDWLWCAGHRLVVELESRKVDLLLRHDVERQTCALRSCWLSGACALVLLV